jgi:hypothetical protein
MSVRPPRNAPPTAPPPGAIIVRGGFPHPTRPFGVVILSFLVAILGVGSLVVGLMVVLQPAVNLGAGLVLVAWVNTQIITLGPLGGAGLFIGGIVLLSISNGLWHQELWALGVSIVSIFALEATIFFLLIPFTYLFFVLLLLFVYLLAVRKHFY